MPRYHITKPGNPGLCKAKVKCPLGDLETEHYATKEEAVQAFEKKQAEATVPQALGRDKKVSVEPSFTTYGVGKANLVANRSGKLWSKELTVSTKACEGIPDQRRDSYDAPYANYEEVLVNGEVIGYIMEKGEDSEQWGFQSLETMNTEHPILRFRSYDRRDAIAGLVEAYEEGKKPLELDENDALRGIYRDAPELVTIDSATQLFSERKTYRLGYEASHIFLIKHGQPVSFMKVMKEKPYGEFGPEVLTVCDAETRPSERRKGYSKELTKLVEERYGMKLETTGTFTPEGYAAFAQHLKLNEGAYERSGPSINPMNFVFDWDRLEAEYRL